jgi:hypothetical protein
MHESFVRRPKTNKAICFSRWMKRHLKRDDPVGDLARDLYDRGPFQPLPLKAANDFYGFLEALERVNACQGALDAVVVAWSEYVEEFPNKKVPLYCTFCEKPLRRSDSELWFHTPAENHYLSHSRCINARIQKEINADSIEDGDMFYGPDVMYFQEGRSSALKKYVLTRIPLSEPNVLQRVDEFEAAFYTKHEPYAARLIAFYEHTAADQAKVLRCKLRMSGLLDEPLRSSAVPEVSDVGCFVYFLQSGSTGPIKIGIATSPENRKKELQTAHAEELRTLLILPGDRKTETHYHERFAPFRLRGEWFVPDAALLTFIEEASRLGRWPDASPPV